MNILGLHFGHDAAVSVIQDGRIIAYILRERHNRVKHAITLDMQSIESALQEANLTLRDLDFCAISSTQNIELVFDTPQSLQIDYGSSGLHGYPCSLDMFMSGYGKSVDDRIVYSLMEILGKPAYKGSWHHALWSKTFPEFAEKGCTADVVGGCIDQFIDMEAWQVGRTLEELKSVDVSELVSNFTRYGFHYPLMLTIKDIAIPGYFVHHHMAHSAASYYLSGYDKAAIITHDGYSQGSGYHGGMYYLAQDNAIYPITPHHLNLGVLYDRVGLALNLSDTWPAGKLMGLAAYGKPIFFDPKFVGNYYDHLRLGEDIHIAELWLEHCLAMAEKMGYEMSVYGDATQATAELNVDIAASTQKLFEEIRLRAVQVLHSALETSGFDVTNLCLSGGTALNCPSNSQIADDGPFAQIYVEPACDDGGLAVGAALAVYHNIMDRPLLQQHANHPLAYLGVDYTEHRIQEAIESMNALVEYTLCDDVAEQAAKALASNQVIGLFDGRSEFGPRALGHRSILADPRDIDNWTRVNQIKRRELWRPFAPAVLLEEAKKWFGTVPIPSPHMLFNATVLSDKVPAVTHVDRTARIQTVDSDAGIYYWIIKHFSELTDVPIVMNTSFNGPGEPIIESPEDALRFFVQSDLDVLFLGNYCVRHRENPAFAAEPSGAHAPAETGVG